MPTPANIIAAVQQKYDALTAFTGKPAELTFGEVWPTTSGGAAVSYPFVRFVHQGTDNSPTFEYAALEEWEFRFEIFGRTAQEVLPVFDRMRFNGSAPEAAAGFWYAASLDMPAGYSFKSFEPVGRFVLQVRSGQYTPTGAALYVLSFDMSLHVHRVTFS